MGFICQNQCISLSILLILGVMATQVMSRELEDVSMYEKYEEWITRYGKIYKNTTEKETRFQIFKENAKLIELSNSSPNKTYKLALNQFADLTQEEFVASNGGFNSRISSMGNNVRNSFKYENVSLSAVPTAVDWRMAGAVTSVKNQGGCGCCWAFSAVACMESAIKLATGKLISLSTQQLVDCDTKGLMDRGCDGGYAKEAFRFVINNKGLSSEANYPYKGKQGSCMRTQSAAGIKGFELVPENNEDALLKAVAHQPVSVSLASNSAAFRFYSSGILTEGCDTFINHSVTVVGYGSFFGTKYWLVQNSWGEGWGENGYIKIKRQVGSKEGMCGLARQPSYPIA